MRDGWFDRLGVFAYSPEEGTAAYALADPVPAKVAEERRDELMEAQQAVHFAWNRAHVGRTIDVLVEAVDPRGTTARGRSPWDAPDVDGAVHLSDAAGLAPGQVVRGAWSPGRGRLRPRGPARAPREGAGDPSRPAGGRPRRSAVAWDPVECASRGRRGGAWAGRTA